jgi:chromosome segregation ATPase
MTLALAFIMGVSLGCDNRTKTEKAMDTIKEKFKAGLSKLGELKNQKEFVDAAGKQVESGRDKLAELVKKAKDANPEAAKKIDEQIAALKASLNDAEEAIEKAKKDPAGTWEAMKAKAIEALKKAEQHMQ